MKTYNKKALDIFKKYNLLAPNEMSSENFLFLKQEGLAFDFLKITHDESVEWAESEYKKACKEKIVASFLWEVEMICHTHVRHFQRMQ